MSAAQVTEAHVQLVQKIWAGLHSREMTFTPCAQLIADSEAKATAELKKRADHWCDMHTVCAKEANQLRAEVDAQCLLNAKGSEREAVLLGRVDRMAKECLNLRAELDAIKAICNEETARAELADEAELAGIRALANRRNKRDHSQDTTHQLVAALDQALDIAQAELATERARLDWLESKCPILWSLEDHATGPYWLLTDFPGYTEETASQHKTARAAIDAAMKEEIK